jgi:hypothetical protein
MSSIKAESAVHTYACARRRQKKVTHTRFSRKLGWLVLPVLLVVGGAATGAVLTNGAMKWVYAVVAVVATGCGVAANQWLASAPELTLRLRDCGRGAPVFYDVAMTDLGVHRSRLAWASGETYVERDIDGDVQAAVSTGQGLVLLHGAALAGKTRTPRRSGKQDAAGRAARSFRTRPNGNARSADRASPAVEACGRLQRRSALA